MLDLVRRAVPSHQISQESLLAAQQSKQNPGVYGAFPYIHQLPPKLYLARSKRGCSANSQSSSDSLEGQDSAELPSPQNQSEAHQPDLQLADDLSSSEDRRKSSEESFSGSPQRSIGDAQSSTSSSEYATGESRAANLLLEARQTSSSRASSSSSLAPEQPRELEEPVLPEHRGLAAEDFVARRSLDGSGSAVSRSQSGFVSRSSSRGSMSAMYR